MIISKPCVTVRGVVIGAYSWEKRIKLDLTKTAQCLKERRYTVKKLLPGMMLLLEMDDYEVSVYPSGKIIVKLLENAKKGEELARIIYECAGILEVVS